jgi:hypothetical protein
MYAHIGYVGAFLLPIENDPSAWAHTDPCRAPIDGSRVPITARLGAEHSLSAFGGVHVRKIGPPRPR